MTQKEFKNSSNLLFKIFSINSATEDEWRNSSELIQAHTGAIDYAIDYTNHSGSRITKEQFLKMVILELSIPFTNKTYFINISDLEKSKVEDLMDALMWFYGDFEIFLDKNIWIMEPEKFINYLKICVPEIESNAKQIKENIINRINHGSIDYRYFSEDIRGKFLRLTYPGTGVLYFDYDGRSKRDYDITESKNMIIKILYRCGWFTAIMSDFAQSTEYFDIIFNTYINLVLGWERKYLVENNIEYGGNLSFSEGEPLDGVLKTTFEFYLIENPTNQVFVIREFKNDKTRKYYDEVIVPVLKRSKLEPIMLEATPTLKNIDTAILEGIKNARFVIADITPSKKMELTYSDQNLNQETEEKLKKKLPNKSQWIINANVMYEIGIAKGFGRRVYFVCDNSTGQYQELFANSGYLPFDISHHTIVDYKLRSESDLKKAKNYLETFMKGLGVPTNM